MAVTTPLPTHVVLGGYTAEVEGTGTGLRSLLREPDGDDLHEVALAPLPSPTYVVAHPTEPWLLAVCETVPSELVSLRIEVDGGLTVLDRLATGGDEGCHLAVSPDGRQVVVAHYGSGTVESFALDDAGRLTGPVGRVASSAPTGPDSERQDGPHLHQVVFDGDELLVNDLGTDRIHRLHLSAYGALTESAPAVELPAGSGPRHLVILGDVLVVACELSVELWLAHRTPRGWEHTQTVPTTGLADAQTAEPILPSALRAVGDRVWVSTRGVNTVSLFEVEAVSGTATRLTEFGCGGDHPRDLVVADDRLWLANQRSDRVSVFDLDALPPSGPSRQLDVPRPACVVLLDRLPER